MDNCAHDESDDDRMKDRCVHVATRQGRRRSVDRDTRDVDDEPSGTYVGSCDESWSVEWSQKPWNRQGSATW